MAGKISGTREWAVAEINCGIGCPHNCRYCYARVAALKSGAIADPGQWSQSRIIEELVEAEHPCYPGQVMFPTSHDIIDDNLDAVLQVMAKLLDSGNRVLVVSKPKADCIGKLCDRFDEDRERLLFRFSITARNDDLLSFWEPGAPPYRERLQALELAFRRGFATSVSIEPMLDADDIEGLIAELTPLVSHSIWIGKMNRIDERVEIDSARTAAEIQRIRNEQTDFRIRLLYEALKDHPLIRWKESVKAVAGLELLSESGLDR